MRHAMTQSCVQGDMHRCGLLVLAAILVMALPPVQAVAQECQGPPGASAVQQYCESIPAAGGTTRPPRGSATASADGSSGSGASTAQSSLPQDVRRQLGASEAGQAVVGLVESADAASPDGGATPGGGKSDAGEKATSSPAADAPSGSPLRAVSSSIESGQTIGDGFLWALALITVAAIGGSWLAYRSRRGDGDPGDTGPAASTQP